MITLLTGVPGSGKTAAAVDMLTSEYKDRMLYVDGLNGLQLEHVEVDVLNWHKDVPDGAVIVVDEVQRKWRPRGPGAKVPDSVAALETHRHRGIDFLIITQNPRLVDSNVRDLVGRHVHIRDTGWMGRWWYEWPECSASVAWKACQNKRRYKLPAHVFKLYTSASIHVKPVRKAPLMLWFIAAAIVALCVALYVLNGSVSKTIGDDKKLPALEQSQDVSGVGAAPGAAPGVPKVYDFGEFIPRQSNRPETAPAYDELRKVVVMPVVVGGLCIRGECACYTQQGTHAGLSSQECSDWMLQRPFDPYTVPLPPPSQAPQPVQQVKQEEGPQSVPMPDVPAKPSNEVTIHEVTRAARAGRLAELGTL